MLPVVITEAWFEDLNQRLSDEGVPHISRPMRAIQELSKAYSCEISSDSAQWKSVFNWFKHNAPPRSDQIGAQFTATYYSDTYFWKVPTLHTYGAVEVFPLRSIEGMSERARTRIASDKQALHEYLLLWADAADYGAGFSEVLATKELSEFAKNLAKSGDQELRGTVQLLVGEKRSNAKAMQSARMATELFLKAYLAAHCKMSEEDGKKKYVHNLEKLTKEVSNVSGSKCPEELSEVWKIFPGIEARYLGEMYPNERLWKGYRAAQVAATLFVRSLATGIHDSSSKNDCRSTLPAD